MNKYTVVLRKTSIYTAAIEVEAMSEDEAQQKALAQCDRPQCEVEWELDDEELDTEEVLETESEEELEGDEEDFEDEEQE